MSKFAVKAIIVLLLDEESVYVDDKLAIDMCV